MKTTYELLKETDLLDLSHVVGASTAYSEILLKATEEGVTLKDVITYIVEQNQKMYLFMGVKW